MNLEIMKLKVAIVFDVLFFVLMTALTILIANQIEWWLTAIWVFLALCWLTVGVLRYKKIKRLRKEVLI